MVVAALTRRHGHGVAMACLCLVCGLIATSLRAQERRNEEMRILAHGVLVRVAVRGVDSTQWYEARPRVAAGGCTWFAIEHAGWKTGRLVRMNDVPRNRQILVPLSSVVAMRVLPFGGAAPSIADSSAWTAMPMDRVRKGEPAGCLTP